MIAPQNAVARRLFSLCARRQGHMAAAIGGLDEALTADPGDNAVRTELARCYADLGRLAAAADVLRAAPEPDAAVWLQLGVVLDRDGRAEEALAAGFETERRSPGEPQAQFLIARCQAGLGDIAAAAQRYRDLAARHPREAAKAWFALLDLKTVPITAAELAAIERVEGDARRGDEDRVLAGFALGQALETAGRFEDAVRAFDAANRRRHTGTWDAAAHRRTVDAIREVFPVAEQAPDASQGSQVVFVLGMPRSGTTLVEQILAAHPQVTGAGELPDLEAVIQGETARRGLPFPDWARSATPADWGRLGTEYLERTKRWQDRAFFTDKMPENWPYVGAILAMLPGARVIGCQRETVETGWSCYKQLFAPGRLEWSYALATLAAYAADELRLWSHFAARVPDRCRTQSHEALIQSFDSQVSTLLDFLGLPDDPACRRFGEARRPVLTASSAQVRGPLLRSTARRGRYGTALDRFAAAFLAERGDFV